MNALPPATVQRITSGQVITSVSSAVKELVENSLDAGATSAIIRLGNYGLDLIEVRDNGSGISPSEACHVALAHYTSKLRCHEDLLHVRSYGFRGEALSSLCSVAEVKITSRTAQQQVASQYTLDAQGHIVTSKPSAGDVGTTVTAHNLFANLPVRRQVFKTARRCKEELREVEDRLLALALAMPAVRLQLMNDKQTVWQRPGAGDFTAAAVSVFGTSTFSQLKLHYHNTSSQSPGCQTDIHISALLPKPLSSTASVLRSTANRSFIIVNDRPVEHHAVHKKLKSAIMAALLASATSSIRSSSSRSHPAYCVMIKLPLATVDVNVNPAKNVVMIENEEDLLAAVDELLAAAYPASCDENTAPTGKQALAAKDVARTSPPNQAEREDGLRSEKSPCPAVTPGSGAADDGIGSNGKQRASEVQSQWLDLVDDDLVLDGDGEFGDLTDVADLAKDPSSNDMPDFPDVPTPPSSFIHQSALFSQVAETARSATALSDLDAAESISASSVAKAPQSISASSAAKAPQSISASSAANAPQTLGEGTAGLANVGGDGWSRGYALATGMDKAIEPIMFLAPKPASTPSLVTSRTPSVVHTDKAPSGIGREAVCSGGRDVLDPAPALAPLGNPSAEPSASAASLITVSSSSVTGKESATTVASPTSPILLDSLSQQQTPKHSSSASLPLLPDFSLSSSQLSPPSSQPALVPRPMTHAEKRASTSLPSPAAKRPKPLATSSTLKRLSQVKLPYTVKPLADESFSYTTGSPVVDVPISFADVKRRFVAADAGPERECWSTAMDNAVVPIGSLHPSGLWCVQHQSKLAILNHFRAKEMCLYRQLCRNHTLLSQPLDKPITITLELVREERLWERLRSMHCVAVDSSGTLEFNDPLLVKNGFQLTQDNGGMIKLTGMSSDIPCYGYPDLVQLLRLIVQCKEASQEVTVEACRPRKVLTYLESEVVRLCRKLPAALGYGAVAEIMDSVCAMPESSRHCFHNRDVLHHLTNLRDLDVD